MDKISEYAENQRRSYDKYSKTIEGAIAQVGRDYEQLSRHGRGIVDLLLAQYFLRRGQFYDPRTTNLEHLKVLDFGCGVGRMMEIFRQRGCERVDGCDISREMLKHAAKNPLLANSQFFLGSGADAGKSPSNFYDISYSFLCLHHIPMRQTRIKVLDALSQTLVESGMIFIEFKTFPGVTAAKIPANHAHWSENMVAKETNSLADVWVTPDALGMVYEDFQLFFEDIAILETTRDVDHYKFDPNARYQYEYNELFVVGSKKRSLRQRLLAASNDRES